MLKLYTDSGDAGLKVYVYPALSALPAQPGIGTWDWSSVKEVLIYSVTRSSSSSSRSRSSRPSSSCTSRRRSCARFRHSRQWGG